MRSTVAAAMAVFLSLLDSAIAGNVKEVSSVAGLDDTGLGVNVNVANYYDGSAGTDGGGGQFIRNGAGTDCMPDGGVVFQTTADPKYCYFRQFTGAVHMNWYGVNSGSAHRDATAAQFTAAFDAAKKYGNGTVVTDGVAINFTGTTNLDIPTGDTLDCQGTIGGFGSGDWTVPTLSASLIVDPAVSVVAHSRSTLQNCVRPNWFTTSTQMDGPREIIDNVLHKFAGTGVVCTDDGCSIQNVAVFGFDVGIQADTTQRFYMNNVLVDSNTGIWWRALPGAARNTNLLVDPLITQGHGVDNEDSWKITAIASDAGQCKLTLDTSSEPNAVMAGDTVYWSALTTMFP
jgi:hypothetical protein